jgi:uracil-DNA glycosylase family 4
MLDRVIRHTSLDRDYFRIDNLLRCQPPGDWLDKAPWERDAINTCERFLNETLEEGHNVVVPLGSLVTRNLLGLSRKRFKVQDFHGTVTRDLLDRFWIVPTFHPSFLQRGATNLIKTCAVDLETAVAVAERGFERSYMNLVCDPDPEWFRLWAKLYLDVCSTGQDVDLVVDIETPDSAVLDEDNPKRQDISWKIIRFNFAYNGEEGVTVPATGPYMSVIQDLLNSTKPKIFWKKDFDIPRIKHAGLSINGTCYDYMWAWHILQSDLPRGLGFVAPFYSDGPPWKHLADSNPVEYGAMDGVQPWRIAYGVTKDLVDTGMWHVFQDHVHEVHEVILDPSQDVGLHVDRDNLEEFRAELVEMSTAVHEEIQTFIPWDLLPHDKKDGWTRMPKDPDGVYGEKVPRLIKVCTSCGKEQIAKTHRCKDKKLEPNIVLEERGVVRYFRKKLFNPASPPQILTYIHHKGLKPGRAKKTLKDSTDKETLERLGKKDPFFLKVLYFRKIAKVLGTYVGRAPTEKDKGAGMLKQMDESDRVHTTFTPKPSTIRFASEAPNLFNIIDDKEENPAAGFRRCVTASPGCKIIEGDYAGIEAVIVGRCCGDPNYIRLAHLGVHANLAANVLERPADMSWSDDKLAEYFAEIKHNELEIYDTSKRCVHGSNYGLTYMGMNYQFPKVFPTQKIAKKYQDAYWEMAPKVPQWQENVRERAHRQCYLGGPGDHPFAYKHWYWSVLTFKPITEKQAIVRRAKGLPVYYFGDRPHLVKFGEDAKRAVAFFPQSTAAGELRETLKRLYNPRYVLDDRNYLGDKYFGKTSLRAPVYDSIMIEVENKYVDFAVEALVREMVRPVRQLTLPPEYNLGPFLNFGVEVKVGTDWQVKKKGGTMETVFAVRGGGVKDDGTVDIKDVGTVGPAIDLRAMPDEEEEDEEEREVGVA